MNYFEIQIMIKNYNDYIYIYIYMNYFEIQRMSGFVLYKFCTLFDICKICSYFGFSKKKLKQNT